MMELCVEAQMSSCLPAITHVSRVYNTWADDLSNDICSSFSPEKRITFCDSNIKEWRILPTLFSLHKPGETGDSQFSRPQPQARTLELPGLFLMVH